MLTPLIELGAGGHDGRRVYVCHCFVRSRPDLIREKRFSSVRRRRFASSSSWPKRAMFRRQRCKLVGRRSAARIDPRRTDRTRDAGAAADDHVVGHDDVAGKAGLAADRAPGTDRGAAGNACLGRNYRVLADTNIVPDLNLVIELHAIADDRVIDSATVNGRVGADLHVVTHRHAAQLRNLDVAALPLPGKAETIRAEHDARCAARNARRSAHRHRP